MTVVALLLAMAVATIYAYDEAEHWKLIDDDIKELTLSLPMTYQIGQMVQIDINYFMTKDNKLNTTELASVVQRLGIGSILNTVSATNSEISSLSCSQWRQLIHDIQTIALENGPKLPIIYGLDSVHGANYIKGATLFPQQIGLAASFNRDLVRKAFAITAKDTRSCGIPWAFAPVLDIALQKAWPRVYETFGEDPYLASAMGHEAVVGLQGEQQSDLSRPDKVAASLKHFVGYSNPRSGQDRTQAWIPDRILRQYFLPSFRAGVNAGAATVMETYGDVNGSPVVGSELYLKTILRDELGFKGMLVTDFDEINNLYWWHHAAQSPLNAVELAMTKTTIDMSMSGSSYNFSTSVQQLLEDGAIQPGRIALSCARVLQLKKDLGLLTDPFPTKEATQVSSVGSDDDRLVAQTIVQESITLLKNDRSSSGRHTLPLEGSRVFLTGPSSDSIALLNSGWTLHWQGGRDKEFSSGSTIKQGILSHVHGPDHLVHFNGCSIESCSESDRKKIVKHAKNSDVIVVCLSEPTYAEKPGNISDMEFDNNQVEFVRALHQTGVPIVAVLTMGRPRLLSPIVEMASAVVHAYFPGSEGGQAIADVLFGVVNPSGKLPITWPKHSALQNDPYWHAFSSDDTYKVEFPFGSGLSYTKFQYNLNVSSNVMTHDSTLEVVVEVANVGDRDGSETVMLFLTAEHRTVSPEVRLLKRFQKVFIPRQTKQLVRFELDSSDAEFYMGTNPQPVLESGLYTIHVGNQTAQFHLKINADFAVKASTKPSQLSNVSSFSSDWPWMLACVLVGLVSGIPVWYFVFNRKPFSWASHSFEYGLLRSDSDNYSTRF